jgi:hypothetical protein
MAGDHLLLEDLFQTLVAYDSASLRSEVSSSSDCTELVCSHGSLCGSVACRLASPFTPSFRVLCRLMADSSYFGE